MSGNLAMGGNKITGLGAPTVQDDVLRRGRAEVELSDLKLSEGSAAAELAEDASIMVEIHYRGHHIDLDGSLAVLAVEWGFSSATAVGSGVEGAFEGFKTRLRNGYGMTQVCTMKWEYHTD